MDKFKLFEVAPMIYCVSTNPEGFFESRACALAIDLERNIYRKTVDGGKLGWLKLCANGPDMTGSAEYLEELPEPAPIAPLIVEEDEDE